MKSQVISAVGVLALSASGFAQNPAAIGGGNGGVGQERDPQSGVLATTVLYDSLFVVDNGDYDVGNGDALGGQAPLGDVLDLRCADDFFVLYDEGFTITRVTADYLTFNGTRPVAVYVRVYGDNGGVPGEAPVHEKLVTAGDFSVSPWDDTVFGVYEGQRIVCENLCMPLGGAGTIYWITIQPVHTGTDGDWFYFARDNDVTYLAPTAGRDGELGNGGFGTNTWTPMPDLGWGDGYGSMKLEGHLGRLTVHAITPGIAGQNNSVEVHGCEPGARIVLYYSLATGTSTVSGCPGVALNLNSAISAGGRTADGAGVATWSGPVGSGLRGRTGYHQAVDTSNCCVSSVMAWTYPN